MIPQEIQINKRPCVLPSSNFGKILGCPDWLRTHVVQQFIHVNIYTHKTDKRVMVDILSTCTQPMQITAFIWPIYKVEHQLMPYTGIGMQTHASDALDESLAKAHQPSFWNGTPLG